MVQMRKDAQQSEENILAQADVIRETNQKISEDYINLEDQFKKQSKLNDDGMTSKDNEISKLKTLNKKL